MLQDWVVLLLSLSYIGVLFALASWGDWRPVAGARGQNAIYALSLAIYCTSWTFYGSVGRAAASGLDFALIYVGPIAVMLFGHRLLARMVALAQRYNVTSIADFIGARYGKSRAVSALVTLIAVVGVVPYVALQLKAVTVSFAALVGTEDRSAFASWQDTALIVALLMALFTMLFGIRRAQATEQHRGMMLAIAFESLVKLTAFLAVGLFVLVQAGGPLALFDGIVARPDLVERFSGDDLGPAWITLSVLSACAFLCLPRQFHVAVVEHGPGSHLKPARWLFPLYLVGINILVVPIAAAGLLGLPAGSNPDLYVLALPMAAGADTLSTLVFIGGLSAATSMVIVACLALSIMVSNELAIPLLLRLRQLRGQESGRVVVAVRRSAVVLVLGLSYVYERGLAGDLTLVSIGLISFAAVAQFAPALVGGLVWRGGHRVGALAGLAGGFAVWAYALFLPSVGISVTAAGVPPLAPLLPPVMAGLDPLSQGVWGSLALNLLLYVIGSALGRARPQDVAQALAFVDARPPGLDPAAGGPGAPGMEELKRLFARFVGTTQATAAFAELPRGHGDPVAFTERLLAGVIGAASARVVLASAWPRVRLSGREVRAVLDEASEAIRQNYALLRTSLDHVSQGIGVFDGGHRLATWNQQFFDLLGLAGLGPRVGLSLSDITAAAGLDPAMRGRRVEEVVGSDGRHLELRLDPMPDGGLAITATDVTERRRAEAALRQANETLEARVALRTTDLTRVIAELDQAKRAAEEANLGKTRVLAAASHDLLQPLHAARLFTAALADKAAAEPLVGKVDQSLGAVEALLDALLDIARLDQGALTADVQPLALGQLIETIAATMAPLAERRRIALIVVPSRAVVLSDPGLLRRVLQNLLSNAIRYSDPARSRARVLIGVRHRQGRLAVEVWDSGPGIAPHHRREIFGEFVRLPGPPEGGRRGLGLGLAIVERICRLLGHGIELESTLGRGSVFRILLPQADRMPSAVPTPTPLPAEPQDAPLAVLVVDDQPAIRDAMRVLLEGWCCQVACAASLDEAQPLAATADLLLVDYHLGEGSDGLAAIAALRRQLGWAVPAALVTADRDQQLAQAARRHQVALLPKPVKPAALRALVDYHRKEAGRRAAG